MNSSTIRNAGSNPLSNLGIWGIKAFEKRQLFWPWGGPGVHIVKVHPTLALWLYRKIDQRVDNWEYKKEKKDGKSCPYLLNYLSDHIRDEAACQAFALSQVEIKKQRESFDDIFESCISYIFGDLWIRNSGDLILLWELDTGAMLLPNVDGLRDKRTEFLISASNIPRP